MLLYDHKKTAITLLDMKESYTDLLQNIANFSALISQGTERVLIFSENRLEWIYCLYASWSAGATMVPVDYMSTADEILFITRDCRPQVFFCSKDRKKILETVISQLDYSPELLVFEEIAPDTVAPIETISPNLQDTALIIYTSGTTGSPKGVMLSFENILANVDAVSKGVPIFNREERVMMLLPLHHIFPLIGTMVAPFSVGATVSISPSLQSEDIISTLQNNRITILIGVPRLYKLIINGIMAKIKANKLAHNLYRLAEKVNSRSFSKIVFKSVHQKFGGHLKFLVCGGAALDPVVGQQFTNLGFEVLEGYGMTETAPMITFTRPGQVTIGSAGTAMSCTDIEIRNKEIVVSGKNVMQGYWNRPEETAEILKDGWLYTGDIGYLDESGKIFITGRKKEIIVLSSGKNINPVLIEQELDTLTDYIDEVGVFVKDDILQAVIRPKLAEFRNNGISDMEEYFRWKVIDRFNQSTSPYKRIMNFTLVDEELPKTRLSKLKRFQLPKMVATQKIRRESAAQPSFEEYLIIKNFIESQTARDIEADDHLEIDIALDSLDKVSLLVFLKSTFGVEIAEDKLMHHQTVRKLSEFVKEKKEKISVELVNWRDILKEHVDLKLPKTWITTNIIKNFTKVLFSFYFRFKAEGKENIPDTPCIIAPNHQSFFDGLFVASLLKNESMKKTYFYAKEKHIRNKWVRSFAGRNNIVIMDINADVKDSIQKLAALLRSGKNIMIFPEGTRSLDGAVGEFKKMFAILSKELNVPVVPVTINGAFNALPAGRVFPRPFKKISVHFQQPIFPDNHSYESLKESVCDKVRGCLQR